jgi:hypothetical protein
MGDPTDDIKRWTARRKAAVVMDIIKGKTPPPSWPDPAI